MPQQVEIPNVGILEFPDGMSQPDMAAAIKKNYPQIHQEQAVEEPKQPMAWGDVATGAAINAVPSVFNLAKGVVSAVASPIDTAKNMVSLASGGILNALPESAVNLINKTVADPEQSNKDMALASALGNMYKQKYGTMEGFKEALSSDPAGIIADVATVLTAGGGAASKIPALNKAGSLATKAGIAIDPLANTLNLAGKGIRATGTGIANLIGDVGSNIGGKNIQNASVAGLSGGAKGAEFLDNLRGNVPIESALLEAKDALNNIRKSRSQNYKDKISKVSADKTVLDLKPIDDALADTLSVSRFKGKSINRSTEATQNKILEVVNEWKGLNKNDFHTAEGLDALKQTIGDIRDSTEFGTPSRLVADRMYNTVKGQIVKQAPDYANVMKDYETASGLIKEVEKSLSLGNKTSADTAMRKLQSLTRNNVSTNYGNRVKLAEELESSGADNLLSNLSAQSMNTWAPRGLGRLVASGIGVGGVATTNPLAIPLIATQSPRFVGEAAFKVGQLAKLYGRGSSAITNASRNAGIDPAQLGNYLYQADQPSNFINLESLQE